MIIIVFLRLYEYEVDRSCEMNENLGTGIAIFQGLSNVALNCKCAHIIIAIGHNVKLL